MKKPTTGTAYEKQADPRRRGAELGSQNDEIIDLEDIIEMPDRPIDEDEDLDLEVEILDVDTDFETQAPQPEQPPRSGDKDLIGVLDEESEDHETLFDDIASAEPANKTDIAQPEVFGDHESSMLDQSMLDELLEETRVPEFLAGKKKDAELVDKADEMPEEAPSVDIQPEPVFPEPPDSGQISVAPPVDFSRTAEELIDRIESRLQEHIRVMVESRLPELVRSIINEEIEKLKREPH